MNYAQPDRAIKLLKGDLSQLLLDSSGPEFVAGNNLFLLTALPVAKDWE